MHKKFFQCGMTGLIMEVAWTGMMSMRNKDKRLSSTTSLIMFPIYGAAVLLCPIYKVISKHSMVLRGSIYTICIFMTEYITGMALKKKDMCPWDYSKSKYNVKGVIRLDYAPAWFGAGLLFENIIKK